MTSADMRELIEARENMLDRTKRYGLYWNAIGNHTDIRQRTHAVHNAFHEITEALKETRLILEHIHDMPVGGLKPHQLAGLHRKIDGVHQRLDFAWTWMTTDPVDGLSCMDPNWGRDTGRMGTWRMARC